MKSNFAKSKYILGIVLIAVLLFPVLCSAEKINEPANLIQTCNNCTGCNISKIVYPNSTIFLRNLPMTKDGTSYNYTVNESYINAYGTYSWWYDCGNGIDSATGKLTFEVTDKGFDVTELSKSGIYFILVISCLFFIGFMFFQIPPVKFSFLLLFILFLVIGINMISITIHNQIGNTHLGAIFDQLSAISLIIYWFIFGLLIIIWVLTTIATLADKKNMRKAREIGEVGNYRWLQ